MRKLNIFIRSLVFNILMFLLTLLHATLSLFTFPLPFQQRYRFITLYSKCVVALAKTICGINYEVTGLENLPEENAIILSNHQSTWETLFFQKIFPPQCWVVKKELLKIPFFGWAFALLEPIAIDRKVSTSAMEQVLQQGSQRLAQGRWLIIFPEGTRVEAGVSRKFTRGGALLAEKTRKPVVPVAHNAGKFWPRRSFMKYPGTICVKIGPVIDTKDKDAGSINEHARQWIQESLKRM